MYSRAIASDGLWSGEKLGLELDGQAILLVRFGDTFHAYEDRCLHREVPLSGGDLNGHYLRCPIHEWEYDLETGACINPRDRCLRRYPVQIRDGIVYIDTGSERAQ